MIFIEILWKYQKLTREFLVIILAVFLCSSVGIVGTVHATFFTAADCSCGGVSQTLNYNYTENDPNTGYSALTCQYGGYGDILYKGSGTGVEIEIHTESPDVAQDEFKGRANNMPKSRPDFTGKNSVVLEWGQEPTRAIYSSKQGESNNNYMYDGIHVLNYKNNNYIFISGVGINSGDGAFTSMMNAAESCAKGIIDKESGTQASQPTPSNPGSDCEGFGIPPEDWKIILTKSQVQDEFINALKEYAKTHTLQSHSSRFDSSDWTDLSRFLFTDDFEKAKTDSSLNQFFTGSESELGNRITARFNRDAKQLSPGDVFQESLDVTSGNVFDALLTAHNYLKEQTNNVRQLQAIARQNLAADQQQLSLIESKLSQQGIFSNGAVSVPDSALTDSQKKMVDARNKLLLDISKQQTASTNDGIYATQLQPIKVGPDNGGLWYHTFITTSMAYAQRMWGWHYVGGINVVGEHQVYKRFIQNINNNMMNYYNAAKADPQKFLDYLNDPVNHPMQWPAFTWTDIDKSKYCWDWWGLDIGAEIYRQVPANSDAMKNTLQNSPFYWGSNIWNMGSMKTGYNGMEL